MRDSSYLIGNKFAVGAGPNKTSFQPGQTPWNKGVKGMHLSPQTEFRAGVKSVKWIPAGSMTIRLDKGSKTPRRWIKFKDDFLGGQKNWMEYAKWIWIQAHGAIQKGLCVHHVNNDSLDDRLENLMLVTRSEHPRLHNQWNTRNRPGKRLAQEVKAS